MQSLHVRRKRIYELFGGTTMKITVIASFAEDRLISDRGMAIREGGPAFFITKVCDDLKKEYELFSGKKGIVEIDMWDKKEVGRVKSAGQIECETKADLVIISTIIDEYPLSAQGNISCLDIQGYVRGDGFGQKRFFDSPELEKFTILKGSTEELRYVPQNRLKKIPVVIETQGEEGCLVRCGEKITQIPTIPVMSADTIGAGDTFFSAYCIKYAETKDAVKSAEFAQNIVKEFLELKVKTCK